MPGDNEKRLQEALLPLSVAKDWETARAEWQLVEIELAEEPETCLCGHSPIKELCYLRNRLNENRATVGNVCVHKFMGISSHLIFQGMKRIMLDQGQALNEAATIYAYERRWINDWEYQFCNSTRNKRDLSEKQIATRRSVNTKVLGRLRRIPPSSSPRR